MKAFERVSFLTNVLTAVCKRPSAEVGKLVKAVVTYATEGIKTDFDDLRLQVYYDLLIQDIDSMRAAAEAKSKKCSESAKCRAARNANSPTVPAKKANTANAANESTAKTKRLLRLPRHHQSLILLMMPIFLTNPRILTKALILLHPTFLKAPASLVPAMSPLPLTD